MKSNSDLGQNSAKDLTPYLFYRWKGGRGFMIMVEHCRSRVNSTTDIESICILSESQIIAAHSSNLSILRASRTVNTDDEV